MEQDELILDGKWSYRSFYNDLLEPSEPLYMQPWAPAAELTAQSSLGRAITATMRFDSGIVLDVAGWTTAPIPAAPAEAGLPTPPGVILRAHGCGATYELRGFLAGPKLIVGTVRCLHGDLAKRPDGALGPFVMLRS